MGYITGRETGVAKPTPEQLAYLGTGTRFGPGENARGRGSVGAELRRLLRRTAPWPLWRRLGYSDDEAAEYEVWLSEQPDLTVAVARKLLLMALSGDIQALKVLLAYHDGLPTQSVDVSVEQRSLTVESFRDQLAQLARPVVIDADPLPLQESKSSPETPVELP